MRTQHDILTTGQVAKICNVAPRTVSKWFDSGQLRGYRIPGSKDRRIPVSQLIRFMRAHGMPLNGLDGHQRRVLIIDADGEFAGALQRALEMQGFCVETAGCLVTAGMMIERLRPHAVLIEVGMPAFNAEYFGRLQRTCPAIQEAVLLAMGRELAPAMCHALVHQGFQSCLTKPFDFTEVLAAIEDAVPTLD